MVLTSHLNVKCFMCRHEHVQPDLRLIVLVFVITFVIM